MTSSCCQWAKVNQTIMLLGRKENHVIKERVKTIKNNEINQNSEKMPEILKKKRVVKSKTRANGRGK